MLSTILEDGQGTGNKAQIDDHGRLSTKAIVVGHMSHHATYHKNAYISSFETTLADANEAHCAFFRNIDAGKDVEIYYINISANAQIEASLCVNDIYTSGGNNINPVNTNLSTIITPSVEIYEGGSLGDLVVNSSNESTISSQFIDAYSVLQSDLEGSLVITYNKSLCIKVIGAAANKVKISIAFALHDAGTKL